VTDRWQCMICRYIHQLAAGVPFGAIGIANPPPSGEWEIQVHADLQAGTYRKTVWREGVLVGAILLGDLGEAPRLEQQIRQGASNRSNPDPPVLR